jgi:hypothetical protein
MAPPFRQRYPAYLNRRIALKKIVRHAALRLKPGVVEIDEFLPEAIDDEQTQYG